MTQPLHATAPLTGTIVALEKVNDPVFATKTVGDGCAILPDADADTVTVTAPIEGKAIRVMPHAFIVMAHSRGILVHVGIDTVQLKGEGFTVHVAQGSMVTRGQKMVTFDKKLIETKGYDPICPVVLMDSSDGDVAMDATGHIEAGADLWHSQS